MEDTVIHLFYSLKQTVNSSFLIWHAQSGTKWHKVEAARPLPASKDGQDWILK